MGRKREDMRPGQWDNITERCPQMRFRFCRFATDEIRAWIMVHIHRYSAQVAALLETAKTGVDVANAVKSAAASCNTLIRLMTAVDDQWSLGDWHTACNVVAARVGDIGGGPTLYELAGQTTTNDGGAPDAT
jgi:hypothetical protein